MSQSASEGDKGEGIRAESLFASEGDGERIRAAVVEGGRTQQKSQPCFSFAVPGGTKALGLRNAFNTVCRVLFSFFSPKAGLTRFACCR